MGEGMLERVLTLGKQARLVEELRGLEAARLRCRLGGQLGNRLQQRQGHLMANHGRRLEQALGLGGQPVNAGGEHGLDRRGHLNGRDACPRR